MSHRAPNCFLTCHLGGRRREQDEELARHFPENLRRFEKGEALIDRIISQPSHRSG